MFDFAYDDDPISLAGATTLAEAGIDYRIVREAIAGDRAMRCPDRDTVLRGGAGAIRDTAMPFEGVMDEAAEPFFPRPSPPTVRQ